MSRRRAGRKEKGEEVLSLSLEKQTVEALVDLVDSVELLRSFLNDQVVRDLSGIMGSVFKLVNAISNTDLVEIFERAVQDPDLDKALLDPPRVGFWGFLSALRNEDVQRGMGIVVELLKAIGKAAKQ